MSEPLRITVISDVICPWCYLGKRRLESALEESGVAATVSWLPFELNPDMPEEGMPRADYRAQKFGEEKGAELDAEMKQRGDAEGVHFAFEKLVHTPNTRRAHMLVAQASDTGLGDDLTEALFRAYFEEGADVGDPQVLRGREIFHTTGCAACHRPNFVTYRLDRAPPAPGSAARDDLSMAHAAGTAATRPVILQEVK